jgi:hypothetical protein
MRMENEDFFDKYLGFVALEPNLIRIKIPVCLPQRLTIIGNDT